MERKSISTVVDLVATVKCFSIGKTGRSLFRGVSRLRYSLMPKVGRMPDYSVSREKSLFRQFKERCVLHVGDLPWFPADDWDWLPVAQRHGLATRLLDWTKNPLAAAYFAVENDYEEDAAVYAFNPDSIISKEYARKKGLSPFDLPADYPWLVLVPAYFSKRMAAQESIFMLHRDPCTPINVTGMVQLTIKAAARQSFRDDLHRIGINRASLFPDIDNLCSHLNTHWSMLVSGNI